MFLNNIVPAVLHVFGFSELLMSFGCDCFAFVFSGNPNLTSFVHNFVGYIVLFSIVVCAKLSLLRCGGLVPESFGHVWHQLLLSELTSFVQGFACYVLLFKLVRMFEFKVS